MVQVIEDSIKNALQPVSFLTVRHTLAILHVYFFDSSPELPFPRKINQFVSAAATPPVRGAAAGRVVARHLVLVLVLVLTRRPDESVRIGPDITLTVLGIRGNQVRLGIAAPKNVNVDRDGVHQRKLAQHTVASAPAPMA
jgi:carbon storage regulator